MSKKIKLRLFYFNSEFRWMCRGVLYVTRDLGVIVKNIIPEWPEIEPSPFFPLWIFSVQEN